MRLEVAWLLLGVAIAVVVAGLLVLGGVLSVRSLKRYGELSLVRGLLTSSAGARRAVKGVLLVLCVLAAFAAVAQPQYGRGTRLVPATDLDVVIVLDFSKSMYARDVAPSRIDRAKAEVARLIRELPGARFGAVAFAGDAFGFPMTSDGAAIAQWLRQLSPNQMTVGGTAIARALEYGRLLFRRDPLSAEHRKVMVLVTDGEDLLGSPISVAKEAARDDITIHVVQIGGRTPEPIPDVSEEGEVIGWRTDRHGKPLTTALSAQGEATLTRIARLTDGNIVRASKGTTGIRKISRRLQRLMTEELTEKVETVYADVYYIPLTLAVLLLLLDSLIGEAPPPDRPPWPKLIGLRLLQLGSLVVILGALSIGSHALGFNLESLRVADPRPLAGGWLYARLAGVLAGTAALVVGAILVTRKQHEADEPAKPSTAGTSLASAARKGLRRRQRQEVSS